MCWRPTVPTTVRIAVDAEVATQPVPVALARRHPVSAAQFWRDWTAAEVAAKLADVPIIVWISEQGFNAVPGVETVEIGDLVISTGQVSASDR